MKKFLLLITLFASPLSFSMQPPAQFQSLGQPHHDAKEALKANWLEQCGDCCCEHNPCDCCPCSGYAYALELAFLINAGTQMYLNDLYYCPGLDRDPAALRDCRWDHINQLLSSAGKSSAVLSVGITAGAIYANWYSKNRKKQREKLKTE